MISFIYLIKVRPYEKEVLNKMEILNEIANIIAVYLLVTFTEVVDSRDEDILQRRRDMAGNIFITFLLSLIGTHILSLGIN